MCGSQSLHRCECLLYFAITDSSYVLEYMTQIRIITIYCHLNKLKSKMALLCSVAVRVAPLRLCFYLLFYLLLISLFTHITSALITYDKSTLLDIGNRFTNLVQNLILTVSFAHNPFCVLISYLIFYIYFLWLAASCQPCSTCLHIPLCTVMLILIFNSTAYCHAHSFIPYILYCSLYLIFYSFYFMYTSLVLYSTIFALSMERTRLTFHCWLYNLCIVVYVTNKTWNLKTWSNKSATFVLPNWGKKHYHKSCYQRWLNLTIG